VLDLATGDGAVLSDLQRVRPDLSLVGIDQAARLPAPPRGMRVLAGTSMEKIPFRDESFALITSQFGIEYGDPGVISHEIGRLLRRGGRYELVVHHAGGPIAAQGAARSKGLEWALAEGGLIEKARRLATARRTAPIPTPPLFDRAPAEAARLFPGQTAAVEIAVAVLQCLRVAEPGGSGKSLDALNEISDLARAELARLNALVGAAADRAAISRLGGHLALAGLSPPALVELFEHAGREAFAWALSGRKHGRI
jgi:SAM-dependent methyltransferase